MAISASGTVTFDTVRTEWGRSGTIRLSEMYRGGSHVRSKAANNNATNLASSVPASGTIRLNNFRGTAKGFRYTFSAGATDQNASALFGSDYSVNYPKEIVIDSGVELGATSTTEEALEIDSGGAGTITVTNNGTLSGAGGAAGAVGGDAFEAAVNCTFINNGTVRAGGGGGGVGGQGSTNSLVYIYSNISYWLENPAHSEYRVKWYNSTISANNYVIRTLSSVGNPPTYRGALMHNQHVDGNDFNRRWQVGRYQTQYHSGGSGGVGAGYNQSAGSGAGGGTNAGTGGTGGGFGTSGSTGANGNSSNGSAGGASGAYLRGSSFVTFTNNGTALGGTA